jgi:hypothetical protein
MEWNVRNANGAGGMQDRNLYLPLGTMAWRVVALIISKAFAIPARGSERKCDVA